MTPLTDTEINETLARGMGYKKWDIVPNVWVWVMDRKMYYFLPNDKGDVPVWNPVESLDQMRLVETRIIEFGLQKRYIHWIAEDMFSWSHYWSFDMLHLTSRQKALAAVKTFGEVEK